MTILHGFNKTPKKSVVLIFYKKIKKHIESWIKMIYYIYS